MTVRVVVLGAGLVATHFAVGVERLKENEIEPYGVPLAKHRLPYSFDEIEIVGMFDVDEEKVGKTVYDVARKLVGGQLPIPRKLADIEVYRGIHLGSMKGLPFKARGLEEELGGLGQAINAFIDKLKELKPDIVVNLITTEPSKSFQNIKEYYAAVERGEVDASHAYAYAVARYAETTRPRALLNFIPSMLANDDAVVEDYEATGSIVLGDDGATGATPLTADLLEHLAERNRYVEFIAQFNIGGNTDFLALTVPERNMMKEKTKSSIVEDILGYDAPHFIKPTGYLEPLGDKKYVAMHIAWKTFNELEDEIFISMRINDSPALAGLVVDAARIAKALLDRGYKGTVYEVNAFFMKMPGPRNARNMSRIVAYHRMLAWLREKGILLD